MTDGNLSRQIETGSAEETRQLGKTVAGLLQAGDLVLLHGGLGAGKTTFTQGLADGLGVAGRVTSPTFIVAREHASMGGGPDLVHVDAYRIEDQLDLTTLDLERSADSAVTVVEWGRNKVEGLSENRLEIEVSAEESGSWEDVDQGTRTFVFKGVGPRWEGVISND